MPTVHIPALFRERCGGAAAVQVEGRTLGELLLELDRRCPGIYGLIVENGAIRPELAIAIRGEVGTYSLDEPIDPDADVAIVPAIAGGRS
ncbi:MAG: MoaD/ThiS family protein [Chloroflexota bacterium]|nr:MoaD/ThiS family protein [Dehalococcoidia bacterium]MDW8046234.1 MoaD/ThiS family protein [Chloroflexota bacterium]